MTMTKLENITVFLFLITGLVIFTTGVIGLQANILFNGIKLDYDFKLFFYMGIGLIATTLVLIIRDAWMKK